MAIIRAFFALLAALVTIVAVIAIKHGVAWELQGASDTTLNVLLVLVLVPAVAMVVWTYLLRPLLERRQQR